MIKYYNKVNKKMRKNNKLNKKRITTNKQLHQKDKKVNIKDSNK